MGHHFLDSLSLEKVPGLIEFDTERLRLRQWREDDRTPFAQLSSDPRVMEFFPALLNRAQSDAMADRCQSLIAERGWGLWAVETKNAHDFIGYVGLHIPTLELPFSPCIEIGWRLGFQHWGKGFATEAARAVLRVGFEELGFLEIVSFASLQNLRSRAVMQRIGMRDSRAIFEHPAIPRGNPLRRHCLYRLSREHWMRNK